MSPGHPFPLIPSLTLSMAVALQGEDTGPLHFAYLRLPSALPRFVELPEGGDLVPIEEIVTANLATLYPGRRIEEVALFRVTRAGDLELEEAGAGDLLQAIEEELDQRTVNPVVRLELQPGTSEVLRSMLTQELRFETGHGGDPVGELVVHETGGLMAPGDLRRLASLPVPGGLFPPFTGSRSFRQRPVTLGARPRRRPAAPPSLRRLRRHRAAAAAVGRRRSRGGGDEDDPLPCRRELADRGGAHPGGRGGEGGGRVRGAQGQLRRGAEHRAG